MGSVGDSAGAGWTTLCTYFEARKWMDTRFEALRLAVAIRFELEPLAHALFLRRFNAAWTDAARELKRKLLPQRDKRGRYAQVRTVNPKAGGREKVRPSHSVVARKKRGLSQHKRRSKVLNTRHKSDRGRARSHHPFNPRTGQGYVKIQPGPGRPRVQEIVSRRKAKLRDRKKEIRRKKKVAGDRRLAGKQPYTRLTPEIKKARKAAGQARQRSLTAARQKWAAMHAVPRFQDERPNHRTELTYRTPKPRQRAKNGSRRHYHRSKVKPKKQRLNLGLVARAIFSNARRAKHLRGYWRDVKRIRGRP